MGGVAQREARAGERLREHGVRATAHRVSVLAELLDEPDDATAQQLHERLRRRGVRVALATVYRTLGLLADEGVVDTLVHHHGERCYRLCGAEHHHHLVCSGCHRVVELGDCELDGWLDRAAAAHGFVPTEHRLEVTGLCAECR